MARFFGSNRAQDEQHRLFPARHALFLLLLAWGVGCQDLRAPEARVPAKGRPSPVRISIDKAGVYKVALDDLSAFGWDPALLSSCSLTTGGVSTPFWIDGIGRSSSLCFLGKASRSRYTPFSEYVLRPGMTAGPDAAASDNSPTTRPPVKRFPCTAHFESNRLYEPLADLPIPWLWDRLVAPGKGEFEIKLEGVLKGPCILTVRLWAKTQAAAQPDHHLRVAANGRRIADQKWDGAGPREIAITIADGILRDGLNRLTLELPGDTASPAEIIFVDSFEVSYARKLEAGENDRLEFSGVSGPVALSGFGGPVTVVDGASGRPLVNLDATAAIFSAQAGHSYYAVGSRGLLKPARIGAFGASGPDLHDTRLGLDYLAVGDPELLAPLAPLLKSYEVSGLRTLAVPKQAVYDQFGDGNAEPEAVRSLLRFASKHWKRAPRYLLLVGDATYDTLGYLHPPHNGSLPGFFTRTLFTGETVTDLQFSQVGDTFDPGIAVGRIPSRSAEEVKVLVDKILKFQNSKQDGSRARILSVADPAEASFREEAKSFLAKFPDRFETALYTLPQSGTDQAVKTASRMADPLLFFYFGHGSIRQLGRDVPGNGPRYDMRVSRSAPIAFHVTCLSGYYVHPRVQCMAEELLWDPESKVVALLAPTGLTLPEHQRLLTGAIAPLLCSRKRLRMGDLIRAASRKLDPDVPGEREVMETFLLFGCPALELPPL